MGKTKKEKVEKCPKCGSKFVFQNKYKTECLTCGWRKKQETLSIGKDIIRGGICAFLGYGFVQMIFHAWGKITPSWVRIYMELPLTLVISFILAKRSWEIVK